MKGKKGLKERRIKKRRKKYWNRRSYERKGRN